MATKLVLHTDRISEEQLAQVDQLLNKIVPADIPIEKYNHLIELPWQGIYPDMESNSAWLQKLSLLIKEIIGNIEFNLRLLIDENKLVLQLGLDATQAQIADVQSLLDRVLPSNLVTEFDPFPSNFTRVEYLESNNKEYVKTTYIPTTSTGMYADGVYVTYTNSGPILGHYTDNNLRACVPYPTNSSRIYWFYGTTNTTYSADASIGIRRITALNYLNSKQAQWGESVFATPITGEGFTDSIRIFGYGPSGTYARVYSAQITEGLEVKVNFIPALDTTGAPCMFDTVTRKAFYNNGTGDFLYPGKETEVTTYSLRNRMYAQMTEHGIRRLYHVPAGYNGGKEEYAEENGFKLLVETPMPEEGYWTPVWHDREDCIELEWVETDPPADENI